MLGQDFLLSKGILYLLPEPGHCSAIPLSNCSLLKRNFPPLSGQDSGCVSLHFSHCFFQENRFSLCFWCPPGREPRLSVLPSLDGSGSPLFMLMVSGIRFHPFLLWPTLQGLLACAVVFGINQLFSNNLLFPCPSGSARPKSLPHLMPVSGVRSFRGLFKAACRSQFSFVTLGLFAIVCFVATP